MKKIFSLFLTGTVAASSLLLTGCIEETLPTSGATQDQIDGSLAAKAALLWGMPAYANSLEVSTDSHYDWGYGSIMHIRDCMTEDLAVVSSSYDWYTAWEQNQHIGKDYASTGFIWVFMTGWAQTTNKAIAGINEETATEGELGQLGAAYTYRALVYLDMARMYEFLPCDVFKEGTNADGKVVAGLTVPIVTEKTTEQEAKNNPRADHKTMYDFILADLNKAETLLPKLQVSDPTVPTMGVLYGLKARLYLWNASYLEEQGEDATAEYKNAQTAARQAIDEGYTPTTKDQWLNTTSGFNTPIDSWMLCAKAVKENGVVNSGILNWTSWMCNETDYGYASAGPMSMIGRSLYDRIPSADFRKLSWQAPEGSKLRKQNTYVDPQFAGIADYASLKFRPGMGEFEDYQIGSATAFPLMRVEEMYFIEAEAAAHQDAAQGKNLLESFMRSYRYASYSCKSDDADDVIDEIILQKRIELWGEGQTYFDIKRLNMSVNRKYTDTNFSSQAQLSTSGRPAWMNFCIVRSEEANNAGVKGWNNPDPSGKYK